MSAAHKPAAPRKFSGDLIRLSPKYSVRFTLRGGEMNCVWLPRMPSKKEFYRMLDGYQKGRHQFLTEIASQMGRAIICAEVQE